MVLAVVRQYVNDHPSITAEKLKAEFILGRLRVVLPLAEAEAERSRKVFQKEYFMDHPISVLDGAVVVYTQWKKDNIDTFLQKAGSMGYLIEPL